MRNHVDVRGAMALVFVLVLGLAGVASAGDSAYCLLYKWGEGGHALDKLPDGIKSEDGKLTAFVQYNEFLPSEKWQPDNVPMFVINRADKPVTLALQDGHPHLYLEVQIDGKWKRAEPFQYPSCGNSYHQITLEPDTFAVFRGYQPMKEDGEAPARYRRQYGDGVKLVSNLGRGLYSRADIYAARIDPVAIRHEVPFGTLVGLLSGVVTPTTNGWGTQRWGIFMGMGSRFPHKSLAFINALDQAGQDKYKNELPGLMGSIVQSRELGAQELIALQSQMPGSSFAKLYPSLHLYPMQALGRRFPTDAITYMKTLADDSALLQGGLHGLAYAPAATLDQLIWCLNRQHELALDRSHIGSQIGSRFGEAALAQRQALIEKHGDDVMHDIKEIERYAIGKLSAARLIEIIEDPSVTLAMDRDEAIEMSLIQLSIFHREEAIAAADRWSASEKPALVANAEQLKIEIANRKAH